MEKICVAVRVRPSVQEDDNNNGTFWNITQNSISLHKLTGSPISPISFSFDQVFDQSCPNSRVYDFLTKDIIFAALEGFNGTVFAYGQTSSGKTYTMNGSENDPGIIHRAVKDIFDIIHKNKKREFLIRVSYMEIYNEEINDLLVVGNHKLPIHESLERGIFVAGLREEIANNAEQVHKLLEAGEVNRHFGETNMNVRSSRSHTIFRMVIESKSKEMDCSNGYSSSDAIRVSVLNLVDLAGSERIAKTGADGVRLKEGKHINKSLMVLGNVINKLSEGAKQRGHIPYRDSKLTRILQSALGGNAKTSIICTVAPEEVHVEETKGTLQFASRAKRVTNCAQVNEILTDAALLKRQKIEIEELRDKLQGSRFEVLEQEILKLRNDLLKYELEHEKLSTELEEERRLHRLRDEHMKEQQMKIDNQKQALSRGGFNDSNTKSKSQQEVFNTPCIKQDSKSFVARRSHYSTLSDCDSSPLPDVFDNVVDEDAWMKLNKGYVADLDFLQMTPAIKARSLSAEGVSPGFSKDHYEQGIKNLRLELEVAYKEKDEAEKHLKEQVQVNNQLNKEIEELKKEVKSSQEIPLMLRESVATYKDIYEDVLSVIHSSVADEKSFTKNLFSGLSEIGKNLFSTLETHCTMAFDGYKTVSNDTSLLQQQCNFLCERLNNTIADFNQECSPKQSSNSHYKGPDFSEESDCWKVKLISELNTIKEAYIRFEKYLDPNIRILEDTKEKYHDLEREFNVMKEERDSLLDKLSRCDENLSLVSQQSAVFFEKYNTEIQKRRGLEEKIETLISAFDARQRLLQSFHSDFKLKIHGLCGQNPISS